MGLLARFRNDGEAEDEIDEGVSVKELKRSYTILDDYPVFKPYASIKIVKSDELGEGYHYFVDETPLDMEEYFSYKKMINILGKELNPPEHMDITPEEYVQEQAELIAEKYHRSLGEFTANSWNKIFYYIVRDLAGYGPIHALMLDPDIEDISNNGVNTPIYVWHRKYESIPTNISFTDEQVLNDFIVKLAHRSAKHISSAQPILDAMLPEKHRLAATFMKEVSTKGSTFCIRKFRADPFSIVDLIRIGTISERIAAYFWLILENKMSFMIIGGTGSGKTSLLNALLSLMSHNDKIVTVEETPELSPPVSNWTQLNSRQSFQFSSGTSASIALFDLIKVSLRYRPDYIVVGEVRGEEAFVLFQALATGHGGLCTMHADSLDHVVKRLTSPPMNVSKVYIPLMNNALHIQRVELPSEREGLSFGRRIRTVWEIEEFDQYSEVSTWDPRTDTFDTWFEDSFLLRRIANNKGTTLNDILRELDEREKYLRDIVESGVRKQNAVAQKILSYYTQKRADKFEKKPSSTPKNSQKKKEVKEVQKEIKRDAEEGKEKRDDAADSELILTTRKTKEGKTIREWRYPPGTVDPETGEKIGGRIARRET